MEGSQAVAPVSTGRAVVIYTMPPRIAAETGITEVGIVELLGDEEIDATKRALGDPYRLGFELAKASIALVNGKRVTVADASLDRAWKQLGPAGRKLVAGAYQQVNNPTDDESEAFMASRRVEVG